MGWHVRPSHQGGVSVIDPTLKKSAELGISHIHGIAQALKTALKSCPVDIKFF
jgi:hypothetical protein